MGCGGEAWGVAGSSWERDAGAQSPSSATCVATVPAVAPLTARREVEMGRSTAMAWSTASMAPMAQSPSTVRRRSNRAITRRSCFHASTVSSTARRRLSTVCGHPHQTRTKGARCITSSSWMTWGAQQAIKSPLGKARCLHPTVGCHSIHKVVSHHPTAHMPSPAHTRKDPHRPE
jgi:hypothetical protein